jgi:hypothetical protein
MREEIIPEASRVAFRQLLAVPLPKTLRNPAGVLVLQR